MQQECHRAVGRALLHISYVEHTRVDMFQRAEVVCRCCHLRLLRGCGGEICSHQAKRQQGAGEQGTAESSGRVAGRHRASPWQSQRCGLVDASKVEGCIADMSG